MEDYLQYMKTLRAQMNEVEEQAAKISVEEQIHLTTIQNLEKDLDFMRNEIKRLKEGTEHMLKAKGQICSEILEKQRKITSLESDSSTLSQTLDLIRNESVTLSAKLVEKSTYYAKVVEEITTQLKEQELEDKIGDKTGDSEESQGCTMKSLMMKLDAAKADLDRMTHLKSNLVLENCKIKQSLELVKGKINDFKPELKEMDSKMLEEELQALLSDKTGVSEYLESLQLQIMQLKEISHTVKCSCGEEYTVELGPCA